MIANLVFTVLFVGSLCLAVVGALAWVSLLERKARRTADPHVIEHKAGRWN